MKVCILSDTHFGVRNNNKYLDSFFEEFYTTIFFPYLIQHKIDTVIQLGDLMDVRKHTNHQALFNANRYFFSKFDIYDIKFIALIGNHDIFMRDSIEINAPELFLTNYKNITIINKPVQMYLKYNDQYPIEDTKISLIPWICKENQNECIDFIKNDTSNVCFGHFEVAGFRMHKGGIVAQHGLSQEIFEHYESVISGHYHHKSKKGNILYAGIPCELTWADFDDQKGFHIYDTETKKLTFIKNPLSIFFKCFYDDSGNIDVDTSSYLSDEYIEQFREKYVKIHITNKSNPYLFDLFLDKVYSVNPIEVNIIDEYQTEIAIENDINEQDDTNTIIHKYIDTLNNPDLCTKKLKSIMSTLYSEALII